MHKEHTVHDSQIAMVAILNNRGSHCFNIAVTLHH